jgi:hypothetical protein
LINKFGHVSNSAVAPQRKTTPYFYRTSNPQWAAHRP